MNKEIKHITSSFPKGNNPFNVPNGYFDALPDRILDQIENQNQLTSKQSVLRYLKPVLALAASFAIIFLLIYVPVKTFVPSMVKTNNTEFIDQDLLPYYLTDEVIYKSFNETEQDQSIDDSVIETVLLASVSDMELMNI